MQYSILDFFAFLGKAFIFLDLSKVKIRKIAEHFTEIAMKNAVPSGWLAPSISSKKQKNVFQVIFVLYVQEVVNFLYSKLLHKMGHYFLDKQYEYKQTFARS